MDMNLASMGYLFFRLAPFILVCFFALGSIINGELKGFVYLIGLIATCFLSFTLVGFFGESADPNKSILCNSFSINNFYPEKTPMSLIILSYTFFYLVFPIAKHKLALFNIPTLIFFPILILADIWWLFAHNCFPVVNCVFTLLVAGACGVGWAAFIDQSNMESLQYYNVGSNRTRCSRPAKQKFRCVTTTTGK